MDIDRDRTRRADLSLSERARLAPEELVELINDWADAKVELVTFDELRGEAAIEFGNSAGSVRSGIGDELAVVRTGRLERVENLTAQLHSDAKARGLGEQHVSSLGSSAADLSPRHNQLVLGVIAQHRTAFGIDDPEHALGRLPAPRNDAEAVAAALQGIHRDFAVETVSEVLFAHDLALANNPEIGQIALGREPPRISD